MQEESKRVSVLAIYAWNWLDNEDFLETINRTGFFFFYIHPGKLGSLRRIQRPDIPQRRSVPNTSANLYKWESRGPTVRQSEAALKDFDIYNSVHALPARSKALWVLRELTCCARCEHGTHADPYWWALLCRPTCWTLPNRGSATALCFISNECWRISSRALWRPLRLLRRFPATATMKLLCSDTEWARRWIDNRTCCNVLSNHY